MVPLVCEVDEAVFTFLKRLSGDDERSKKAERDHAERVAALQGSNAKLVELEAQLEELGRKATRSKRFSTTIGTTSSLSNEDRELIRSLQNGSKAHSG